MADDAHRKMVLSSDDTERRIDELSLPPFRLSRSAAYRAGIKMLHEYLINNTLPDMEENREKSASG